MRLKKRLIKEELVKFKSISVRDSNTFDFVKKITGIKPQIVVDPLYYVHLKFYLKLIQLKFQERSTRLFMEQFFQLIKKRKSKNIVKTKISY